MQNDAMRTLVHLSDLHFGRVDAALLEPLAARVRALTPHLVVVSGDLTQRARSAQFAAARRFLDTLPRPQLVVPGNHDVPLYNVWARFASPLAKYRRYISDDLQPAWIDEEIAVVGVNTARSLAFKEGRIGVEQIEAARRKLCDAPAEAVRIVVTHHPFDLPPGHEDRRVVGRASAAMKAFARCGADILLSGHLHASHTSGSAERYRIEGHSAIIVQAGTATSTRGRGEANSFNVLRVSASAAHVERHSWDAQARDFALGAVQEFRRSGGEWRAA